MCELWVSNNPLQDLPTGLSEIQSLEAKNCGIHLDNAPTMSTPEVVIAPETTVNLDDSANEAAWQLQGLILGMATSLGLVAICILGMRWRMRSKGKKKRE